MASALLVACFAQSETSTDPLEAVPTDEQADPAMRVEQTGEGAYVISGVYFRGVFDDVDEMARIGRVLPHRDADGTVDGFRVTGMRPQTLGPLMGLVNGDVINAVNDLEIRKIDDVMSAYAVVKQAPAFTLSVTRAGETVRLSYTMN